VIHRNGFVVAASLSFTALGSAPTSAAHPDCTALDAWQTMSAYSALKAEGELDPAEVNWSRSKTVRLASEPVSAGRYRQIHLTRFVSKSGRTVTVITNSLASHDECSESFLEVFVASKRLR
jgi:hypothetical protein